MLKHSFSFFGCADKRKKTFTADDRLGKSLAISRTGRGNSRDDGLLNARKRRLLPFFRAAKVITFFCAVKRL